MKLVRLAVPAAILLFLAALPSAYAQKSLVTTAKKAAVESLTNQVPASSKNILTAPAINFRNALPATTQASRQAAQTPGEELLQSNIERQVRSAAIDAQQTALLKDFHKSLYAPQTGLLTLLDNYAKQMQNYAALSYQSTQLNKVTPRQARAHLLNGENAVKKSLLKLHKLHTNAQQLDIYTDNFLPLLNTVPELASLINGTTTPLELLQKRHGFDRGIFQRLHDFVHTGAPFPVSHATAAQLLLLSHVPTKYLLELAQNPTALIAGKSTTFNMVYTAAKLDKSGLTTLENWGWKIPDFTGLLTFELAARKSKTPYQTPLALELEQEIATRVWHQWKLNQELYLEPLVRLKLNGALRHLETGK